MYRDIWERFENLQEDEELAKFFGEVLARRTALEEDEGSRGGLATDTPLAGGAPGEPVWGGNSS